MHPVGTVEAERLLLVCLAQGFGGQLAQPGNRVRADAMGGEPGQRAPTGDVGHLEFEAAPLRCRGRVVQLVCESRRERTQRQKPVAVALHCCVVRDHGNEHVHDGLEDRRLGHQQAPKCVRLDEEEPAVDGCSASTPRNSSSVRMEIAPRNPPAW